MNKYKNMEAGAKVVFWIWVALAVSALLMVGSFFATSAGLFVIAHLLLNWSQGIVVALFSFYFAVYFDGYIDDKIAMLRGDRNV
jgi:hypothetical protein